MRIGDNIECKRDADWQDKHQRSDRAKARKLGKSFFMGNAAAYMHLDEAYVVVAITQNGGLKIRGFAATVSSKDVQVSTKPVFR